MGDQVAIHPRQTLGAARNGRVAIWTRARTKCADDRDEKGAPNSSNRVCSLPGSRNSRGFDRDFSPERCGGATAFGGPGSHLPVALWFIGALVFGCFIAYGIMASRRWARAEKRLADGRPTITTAVGVGTNNRVLSASSGGCARTSPLIRPDDISLAEKTSFLRISDPAARGCWLTGVASCVRR